MKNMALRGFMVIVTLASFLQASQVGAKTSDPDDGQVLTVGDAFHLIAPRSSSGCMFTLPNCISASGQCQYSLSQGDSRNISHFDDRRPNGWTFSWLGEDSDDCGLSVWKSARADHGKWTAYVGGKFVYFNVTVFVPPQLVAFETPDFSDGFVNVTLGNSTSASGVSDADANFADLDASTLNVTCLAEGARPVAEVSWFLDDERLFNNITDEVEYNDVLSLDLYTLRSTLVHRTRPSYNGKRLRCVASHFAYTAQELKEGANEAAANLTVLSPPDSSDSTVILPEKAILGEQATVKLRFVSNPDPLRMTWLLHDLDDSLPADGEKREKRETPRGESSEGRYTSKVEDMGNGAYQAVLTISELQESDQGKDFRLRVRNSLGEDDYTFKFDRIDALLSAGQITGIVIGVVAFLALAGLAGFFLLKRRRRRQQQLGLRGSAPVSSSSPGRRVGGGANAPVSPHGVTLTGRRTLDSRRYGETSFSAAPAPAPRSSSEATAAASAEDNGAFEADRSDTMASRRSDYPPEAYSTPRCSFKEQKL